MSQTAKTEGEAERDRLYRMAKAVNEDLVNEDMMRSIGEAVEAAASEASLAPADPRTRAAAKAAPASDGSPTARSPSPAYSAQMRAYRETA